MSKSCREYIKELKQQLALTEKALELACEAVNEKYAKPFGNNVDYTYYFKTKAKEMTNESNND